MDDQLETRLEGIAQLCDPDVAPFSTRLGPSQKRGRFLAFAERLRLWDVGGP
jgi:hypothetical protein